MKKFALLLILSVSAAIAVAAEQKADGEADALAREVWQASGGENWSKVKALRFTFVVEEGGNQLASAEHQWDLRAGTDRVKWKGKDVTVNLASPAQDADGKAAYARWVNDSYWLLVPLKVLDPGVKRAYDGKKESEGVTYETLRLTFEQVGLTPGDQYVLYIDPATKLVRAWDYIPDAQTTMHATWENYQTLGGLQLSTVHHFGGKTIRFADVHVSTD
ncbi:hypothetical protein BH18VER1_BH18VER1_10010 [soil metagenome]